GPWNWTDDRSTVVLDGWEGIVAREETPGIWALYYDEDDDHLRQAHGSTGRVAEVGLQRR
ncbi:hypothetical protein GGX14DRAFT_324000, partial [Mycena pura]